MVSNSYGFLVHPYLTLCRLRKDRSQVAIFLFLWMGACLGSFVIFLTAFFFLPWLFPNWVKLRRLGMIVSLSVAAFLLFFTGYLVYWVKNFFQEEK